MKVVVFNSVTIDGVMQVPARPDEDTRDGFRYGGWAAPYMDPEMGRDAMESVARRNGGGGLLLGRLIYESLYSVRPKRTDKPSCTRDDGVGSALEPVQRVARATFEPAPK